MERGEDRRLLQQEIIKRRLTGGYKGEVEPPYHLSGIEMMYYMGRFDPDLIREIVPHELTPFGSDWGTVAIYDVPHGWGMAPYTALILGFEVEGYAPVDGQPAQYLHSGFYSHRAGEILRSRFNANYVEGWSRQYSQGGTAVGEAGQGDLTVVRMSGEISNANWQTLSGTNHYIGKREQGGFNLFSVAFTGEFTDASDAKVEFFAGAEAVIRVTQPFEFHWTAKLRNAAFTFSRPRQIGAHFEHQENDARGVALMELFAHSGRAAAIVSSDGTLTRLNSGAEHLFASHNALSANQEIEHLIRWLKPKLAPLAEKVGDAGSDLVSPTITLDFGDAMAPTLAQAIVLDEAVLGAGNLVVFFDDPGSEPHSDDIKPTLQLLGLSNAEARIAATVGSGLSSDEAAEKLELSVNTVRSALKIIYDKLGIGRQSELARIVTRLEANSIRP